MADLHYRPPEFRLYQAQQGHTETTEELRILEKQGKRIHVVYAHILAIVYSLAMTVLALPITDLPINWPLQIVLHILIFTFFAVAGRFRKQILAGLGILSLLLIIYAFIFVGIKNLSDRLMPVSDFFAEMMLHMFGGEAADPKLSVYAVLIGALIAILSSLLVAQSSHPWIMLIASSALYGFSLTEPSLTATAAFFLTLLCFYLRLSRRRDFALIPHDGLGGERVRISSYRYRKTALPIVVLLLLGVFGLHLLLPPNVFYSKTIDEWMTKLTGISMDDKSIGYYEFSLRYAGYYPLDTRLGGPVTPSDEPFIEVEGGPESLYLRGAVYSIYTGAGWRQDSMDPNWQFGHRRNVGVQNNILGTPLNTEVAVNGVPVRVSPQAKYLVRPLREQQVVFNAGRPSALSYYNSNDTLFAYFNIAGTMYADRVMPDDGYIVEGEAFRVDVLGLDGVLAALQKTYKAENPPAIDGDGDPARYLQLPDVSGLAAVVSEHDQGLYELVYSGGGEPAAKAVSIRQSLAETLTYNLDISIPPEGVDFVTYFLESKEGYCTYFASALAVLLREAGIPARYVEGFLVPGQPGGGVRVINGENAHAWTEVWLDQLGWIPLDATPPEALSGLTQEEPLTSPPTPTPTPPPPTATPTPPPPFDVEPEVEQPKPEPSVLKTILGILLTILRCLLYLLPIILYLGWRFYVWKKRHDIDYLARRFGGRERDLVKAVWTDLKALWALRGITPAHDESVRAYIRRRFAEDDIELTDAPQTWEIVEKALYSLHEMQPDEIVDLLLLYRDQENKAKDNLPRLRWLFCRFLWSPKHPL